MTHRPATPQKPTSFFEDEWRCPIFVDDICTVCRALLQQHSGSRTPGRVYNMGGPDRLSRVDMAQAVAAARGRDTACIVAVPSASVARPVVSPADISMECGRLEAELGLKMVPFSEALRRIWPGA